MRVGIFGGTFDPPHMGHLSLAEIVLDSKQIDEIWFVPCLKHMLGKQPIGFEQRLDMIKLLIKGKAKMNVCDVEKRLSIPGRTLLLVTTLKAEYPNHQFRLVAGSDIYHERHKWYKFDEIARLAPPIYVDRTGIDPILTPTLKAPPSVSSTELRRKLRLKKVPHNLIPASVVEYIQSNNLYGF